MEIIALVLITLVFGLLQPVSGINTTSTSATISSTTTAVSSTSLSVDSSTTNNIETREAEQEEPITPTAIARRLQTPTPSPSPTSSSQACDTPTDPQGTYKMVTSIGPSAIWSLKCNVGYAPTNAAAGMLKRCNGQGGFLPPEATACKATPGCSKEMLDKITGDNPSKPNSCFQETLMQEGTSCSATCPTGYSKVGHFICSEGEIIGDSGCIEDNDPTLSATQATGVAATYRMSLTNCNEGYAATSCASVLRTHIEGTLDTRTLRVDVQNMDGRIISSTSQSTYNAGTTPPSGGRLLSTPSQYDIFLEVAAFPDDASGAQSFAQLVAALMVTMQDMGTPGASENDRLIQKLASASPVIDLSSTEVKVAPRQFATSVAMNVLRSTITDADSLAPPVFPTTTTTPEPGKQLQLWVVIVLSAGAVVGVCVTGSMLRFYRWYNGRLRNS